MGGNLTQNCVVALSVANQAGDTGLPSGTLPSIGTPNGNNPYTTNSTFTAVLLIATRFDTPPGTYTFHVKASGGAGCEGNGDVFSQQLTPVVNPVVRPTSTTVTSSSNPSTYGNNVTFTATVNGLFARFKAARVKARPRPDTNLIPPGTQYGATGSNPERR